MEIEDLKKLDGLTLVRVMLSINNLLREDDKKNVGKIQSKPLR